MSINILLELDEARELPVPHPGHALGTPTMAPVKGEALLIIDNLTSPHITVSSRHTISTISQFESREHVQGISGRSCPSVVQHMTSLKIRLGDLVLVVVVDALVPAVAG